MHTPNKLVKFVVPKWYSRVELGDYSFMNDEAEVHSFRTPQTIKIGKYSSIGKCKFMVDGDHNIKFASTYPFNELLDCKTAPQNCNIKMPPTVGHDCWICDDAVIFGNVSVGHGAVVAGGSIVTKDVPPYAVVAGNPAQIVKYRFSPSTIERLLDVKWWNMDHLFICSDLAPVIDDIEKFLKTCERCHHD